MHTKLIKTDEYDDTFKTVKSKTFLKFCKSIDITSESWKSYK